MTHRIASLQIELLAAGISFVADAPAYRGHAFGPAALRQGQGASFDVHEGEYLLHAHGKNTKSFAPQKDSYRRTLSITPPSRYCATPTHIGKLFFHPTSDHATNVLGSGVASLIRQWCDAVYADVNGGVIPGFLSRLVQGTRSMF